MPKGQSWRGLATAVVLAGAAVLAGCTTIPSGLSAVTGFEPERYTGTWYEIARYDYIFERGLRNVTATYELLPDGQVRVLNRGIDERTCQPRDREGRARFNGPTDVASLSVSFFGLFAGGYNVIAIDPDYRVAIVAGPNRNYLWILSRTPTLPAATLDQLMANVAAAGFDTSSLIMVDQSQDCTPT